MEEFKLVIDENIEEIKEKEFLDRNDIDYIVLPPNLKRIGRYAFYRCSNIKTIVLPNTIERIEDYAFGETKAIIFVPKSIKYIGREAFGKDSVVFLESGYDDFNHFETTETIYDYPDSYYRGPSMGAETIYIRFYEDRCKIFSHKTYQDYLDYIKKNN